MGWAFVVVLVAVFLKLYMQAQSELRCLLNRTPLQPLRELFSSRSSADNFGSPG